MSLLNVFQTACKYKDTSPGYQTENPTCHEKKPTYCGKYRTQEIKKITCPVCEDFETDRKEVLDLHRKKEYPYAHLWEKTIKK